MIGATLFGVDAPFVELAPDELEWALEVARIRDENNGRAGRKDGAAFASLVDVRGVSRTPHEWGAIGELAAHNLCALDWNPLLDKPDYSGDLAHLVEVKTTRRTRFEPSLVCPTMSKAEKALMIRRPFLLAVVDGTRVVFPGWAWGRMLLRDELFGNHFGTGFLCWRLPLEDLRPTRSLVDLVVRHLEALADGRAAR